MPIDIKPFFDPETATFTYVVMDKYTSSTAIIDSVLNYDQYSGRTNTKSADEVIDYVTTNNLKLELLMETHIHADHLTASHYIKSKLGGKICIGSRIKEVLDLWIPIFNTAPDTPLDASQFDQLLEDNQVIHLGNTAINVFHTPGHTPACASYLIEDSIFVGDALFMPDIGTGRTDFPGGSAESLYDSVHRILALPEDTKIYLCHDYPPQGRDPSFLSTVADQKRNNILIHERVSKDTYVQARNKRDEGKPVPKLLLPSIQVNLRSGSFGKAENNGTHYVKIPVNRI